MVRAVSDQLPYTPASRFRLMMVVGVLAQIGGVALLLSSQPDIGMQLTDEAGWFWGTILGALSAIVGLLLMLVGAIAMGVLLGMRAQAQE